MNVGLYVDMSTSCGEEGQRIRSCGRYFAHVLRCDDVCRKPGTDSAVCAKLFDDVDFSEEEKGIFRATVRYCKDAHPIEWEGVQVEDLTPCSAGSCLSKGNPFIAEKPLLCAWNGRLRDCPEYLNMEHCCDQSCPFSSADAKCFAAVKDRYCNSFEMVWSTCSEYSSVETAIYSDFCNSCNRAPFIPPPVGCNS